LIPRNKLRFWPSISLCLICGERIKVSKLILASEWKGWAAGLEARLAEEMCLV